MTAGLLLFEFAVLFVGMPLTFLLLPVRLPPLPVLWLGTLYCYLVLRHDPSFPQSALWNSAPVVGHLAGSLALFALVAAVMLLGVRWHTPELLFELPRTRPLLWLLVMILYPILSVYPQGIVYRAFLMHRYAPLVAHLGAHVGGSREAQAYLLILISAAAFAYMHVIFRNRLAVGLTFAGGLLFAWRYENTHSLALSSIEHALYGSLLFTLGLGRYIYLGRGAARPKSADEVALPR